MIHKRKKKSKIIAITMGDPGGIGPEVTLKALAHPEIKKLAHRRGNKISFCILGSPDIFAENVRIIRPRLSCNVISCIDKTIVSSQKVNILDLGDDAREVTIGTVSLANAVLAYHALEVGAQLAFHHIVDALVTAPINKEALQLFCPSFTGHTEYLARIAKIKKYAMLLMGGPLRVVLATMHMPLHKVSSTLNQKDILTKIELIDTFLKKQLRIKKPIIGVAALNPHAGEGGKVGREEIEIISPAIKKALRKGLRVRGPIPGDVIFHDAIKGKYDALLAMYHDQGLGPLKMLAFDKGVNITLNLPFVRTSPDHGTAFDIAYKNKANPDSMIEAIKTAIQLI